MLIKGVEAYSIDHISGNALFSKDGTVSLLYQLVLPPKYSISESEYDERCLKLNQAFRNFPNNTYAHRQELYLKQGFDGLSIERDSYLGRDSQKYFDGREFMQHTSLVCFTIKNLKSLEKAYQSNPFSYKKGLHKSDFSKLEDFEFSIDKAVNVINSIPNTSIIELEENFIREHITKILNGFEDSGYYDLDFRDKSFGSNSHFEVVTLNRAEYFPKKFPNVRKSEISKTYQAVFEGFLESIGESFNCNHIVNHIVSFTGKKELIKQIEVAKKEYGNFRKQNEVFEKRYKDLTDVLEEQNNTDDDLVLLHINIILFEDDPIQLERNLKELKRRLDIIEVSYYQPKKEVLQNVFLGSVFGREKLLHPDFFFMANLLQTQCLTLHTSTPTDEETGIYLNSRLDQRPLRRKLWYEDMARNGLIVAATGGGKSVMMLTIMTQFMEKGINVVVAEFGRSFEFITKLYPDISQHVRLKADTPLGINPFDVQNPSNEKIGYLAQIVMKSWREKKYIDDTSVIVSVERILEHYYKEVTENHSYESFYNFVCEGGNSMLYALEIEEKFFDLDSFKHNCRQFITGGKYENVFKASDSGTANIIKEKQLVVFELTEIKKDPFLVTLILLILQDTIDQNILADRSKKGILIFDEFAETAQIRNMYTGEEVIQTVSVLNQKIRKENGAVYLIIQDFVQLPDNDFSKSIVANTQLFFVLPSGREGFERTAKQLRLQPSEVAEMQSIENGYNAKYPYSELWLKRYEKTEVLRNELSPATYLAFQTKGEQWDKLNKDYETTQNLETSIDNLLSVTT
ncbi:MAG: hypothetical protein AAFU74_00985 [Bacteroidota bacterium]